MLKFIPANVAPVSRYITGILFFSQFIVCYTKFDSIITSYEMKLGAETESTLPPKTFLET